MAHVSLDKFKNDFFKEMKDLWEKKSGCDVTIIIGEYKFKCHRLVLALASSYFKKLFYGNFKEKNSDVVILHDLDVRAFENILQAIYSGEIKFDSCCNFYQVLKTSSFLNISGIEEACISYVLKHNYVDHIIEVCIFANVIGHSELANECADRILADFLHYSKTEAFKNLPFDVLKLILSRADDGIEADNLLLAVIQWSKLNNVDVRSIKALLESADFLSINSTIMAKLINSADNEFVEEKEEKSKKRKLVHESNYSNDKVPKLNAFVSAIDVKSSERGWAMYKFDKGTNKWVLNRFEPTYSFSCGVMKTVVVGKKLYKLWYDEHPECNRFYEENTQLDSPPQLIKRFHVVADDHCIYVLSVEPLLDDVDIFVYNCDSKKWTSIATHENDFLLDEESCVAFYDSKIYVFSVSLPGNSVSDPQEYVGCFDCRTSTFSTIAAMPYSHYNGAACSHNGKIYICGSSEDKSNKRLSVFDIETKEWSTLQDMNIGRAFTHRLVYYDGFLYVIDHKPFVELERYNIALNRWFSFPSIPSQAELENIVVSTGRFLDANVSVFL